MKKNYYLLWGRGAEGNKQKKTEIKIIILKYRRLSKEAEELMIIIDITPNINNRIKNNYCSV